jgi:hypothetical protein
VEQLGSTALCDSIFIYIYKSQDLTSYTMLSDGVAIVGQTLAGGFECYGLITETVVSVLCQKARHRAGPCFNHDSLLFLRCALGSCSLQLVVEDPLHGLAIGRNCHFDNADDLAFAQGIQGNVTVSGTAIVVTGHSVTLTWTASQGATSYNIYRTAVSGGPYVKLVSGISNITYSDVNVTHNQTLFYVTTAVNGNSESAYSSEASAVIP